MRLSEFFKELELFDWHNPRRGEEWHRKRSELQAISYESKLHTEIYHAMLNHIYLGKKHPETPKDE